jgi:hypothetical protein
MLKKIESLAQFYDLMWETVHVRRQIVKCLLNNEKIEEKCVDSLKTTNEALESLPKEKEKYRLKLREGKDIYTELTYEIDELQKDLIYLAHSEETFYKYLEGYNPGFFSEIEEGLQFLSGTRFKNFITDRDGTVNNYCGRYMSAIQSIYNSIFLVRFACDCTLNSVILTSAPLENFGLLDLSVDPQGIFIYAGSKGREYVDKDGKRGSFPIEKAQQQKLDTLNEVLSKLLKSEEYEQFSLIGSGLQFKFGQTTVAHQDIYGTINVLESEQFLKRVSDIVYDIDPEGNCFRIENTGKDIEIILTIKREDEFESLSEFEKGDGIIFLDDKLNLNLNNGPNLICGDTSSDVAMVKASLAKTEDTWAIFVTDDGVLKQEVRQLCANSFFVSSPDILITILQILSKRMYT